MMSKIQYQSIDIASPVRIMIEGLQSGITTQDLLIMTVCSIFFITMYFTLEKQVVTLKSRSWIIMLLASSVLAPFGAYYAYDVIMNMKWNDEYIYGEDMATRFVILYFTASNIVDFFIGFMRYREHVDPLTTVFHHIFYVIFMLVILSYNYSRGFVICFFMEIPTWFLALGSVWPSLRSDYLFGVSFFLTRVLFNAFQAYKLAQLHNDGYIWKICCMVLCLHLYWFKTWWDKYGTYYNYGYNLLQAEMSTIKAAKKID